jgi:hypothetical protein
MTDIYRQELAIPEKRRVFGWLLLLGGAVMVMIAIGLFYQEASMLQKFDVRPWELTQKDDAKSTGASTQNVTSQKQQFISRAQPLFWIVVMSLGMILVFILVASLNHRLAGHLKASLGRKRDKTVLGDPWKESGEKFKLDSDEKE